MITKNERFGMRRPFAQVVKTAIRGFGSEESKAVVFPMKGFVDLQINGFFGDRLLRARIEAGGDSPRG